MNLREALPLELQERRLKLLKEVKAIDDELQRRLHPFVINFDKCKARRSHHA